MKREYISPTVEVIQIEMEFMIATSVGTLELSNNDVSMSNDRRGSWGDLWNQSSTQ